MLLPGFEAEAAVGAGPGLLHWAPGTDWASGHLFRAAHPSVAGVGVRAFQELKIFFFILQLKKEDIHNIKIERNTNIKGV